MKLTRHRKLSSALLLALTFAATAALGGEPNVHAGRAKAYQHLDAKSLEEVTASEAIRSVGQPNVSASRIWKLLEHGEKVECMSCIPVVAKLLYDSHPKTREISAWWLRRRIFGVFGPGQVYSQVVATLNDASRPDNERAYAANALGEFLSASGVKHVAKAAVDDPSSTVRVAAVGALQRLNHEGPSLELGRALSDPDEGVRLAALKAAMSINVFSSVPNVVARIDDASPRVRRRAAEVLGSMRAVDAVVALSALTDPAVEPDVNVRQAAVWALGQIADPGGKPAVQAALADSEALVRNTARIALRRL